MSGIMFIEEMSKPYRSYKRIGDKTYKGFKPLRLKVKRLDIIKGWWEITRCWEKRLCLDFLGPKSKRAPIKENFSGQFLIYFTPLWLYKVLSTTGALPSGYAFQHCLNKLRSMTKSRSGFPKRYVIQLEDIEDITVKQSMYENLFRDKKLAAAAFIVSFDLEFKGVQFGRAALCMTTRYEDFLDFMLSLAKKWHWNTSEVLSNVSIDYSINRGIKASPKKEFGLSIKSLEEIYNLGGSLLDREKDELLRFHIKRSKKPVKIIANRSKNIVISQLKKYGDMKVTDLQIPTGVRADVILDHLRQLEKDNKVSRERHGKYYLWSYKGD